MKINFKNFRTACAVLMVPLLFSCATITVNVYFPDKEVEAVYEDIESGLDFDVIPQKKDTAAAARTVKTKSRSDASIFRLPQFLFLQTAWADAKVQQNINAELKKMEDVQNSLTRRKDRLETLARLFGAGLVGLKKDGSVGALPEGIVESPGETVESIFVEQGGETEFARFVREENADRKILVRGMAVATLRATEQDEKDDEALENGIDKSRAFFAKSQIGKLKPGWFYQDEDGKWRQVEAPEEQPRAEPAKNP